MTTNCVSNPAFGSMNLSPRGSKVRPTQRCPTTPLSGRLEGRQVVRAYASGDGDLRIEFADRASPVVPFDPDFEAWTVAAPEGFKAVSVAGGGLTVWD